jgi:hypothetical protein
MGLFDTIQVRIPINEIDYSDKEFQTKSFDPAVDHYIITQEGRLLIENAKFISIPEEERYYYGKPEWNERPVCRIAGSIKRVVLGLKDTNYHGDIIFYNSEIEFKARFTNGELEWIEEIKDE